MALRVMSMAEIRLEVLLEAARSGETVTEVCRRHGISRETYYVYLRRYQGEGIEGLESRSRQPQRQPARMASDIEVEICRMRKDHPRWGARRIRTELARAGSPPWRCRPSTRPWCVTTWPPSDPRGPKPADIRIVELGGVTHIYFGEELIRSLVLDHRTAYQRSTTDPSLARPGRAGRSRPRKRRRQV